MALFSRRIQLVCTILLSFLNTSRPQPAVTTITSTATLSPNNDQVSGAAVYTNNNEVSVINNGVAEVWDVSIQSQGTWQFILLLDGTWGFADYTKSSIKLTVNSDSSTSFGTATFDKLLFGFTSADNLQYISTSIQMDDNGDPNYIYPECSLSSLAAGSGDVASLPSTDRSCDIAGGSCLNWDPMSPENQSPTTAEFNGFPITFTFENDPINDILTIYFQSSLFSTDFIQSCSYSAFPVNGGFKVYMGGNDLAQSFRISSFFLEAATITPTPAPVVTPIPTAVTSSPSLSPTKMPSNVPSQSPTNAPSVAPSNAPSRAPTTPPSNAPTTPPTNAPTLSPTNAPSYSPTFAPTPSSITPTVDPTSAPSLAPTVTPSHYPTQEPTFAVPTLDPTTYPTFDPTIGTTTASITGDIVSGVYTMVIDADFAETQARLEAINESLEQFGIEVIANAMHQDSTPSLQSVEIGIVEIRSGSIVIEYTLSAPQQLLDLAAERTEQSVGQQLILKIGDSWGQWGTLASFDVIEATTTPSPVTMQPTPMPVDVAILPVGDDSDEAVVEDASNGNSGGLGGGLTTPILLVVLIGCCLLCVVIAVLVNHGCRKQMEHDGEYHHKYASVAGFQNLYRNRKSKLSKDAMELQHNINMVNQHGQHESDGPYPHSKAHHEEPPLPSMHHHQTSTLESASGSHEDGYSNPPSGQSQDSSSIQQPVPDGGAHPNNHRNHYQYQHQQHHNNQYNGRHQHQHMESPQHGDYLMSTDTESQDDTGTPMNSHISPSMNARGGHNVDISESHPAGTVMQVSNNLQRKYFDHKLPAPRGRKHVVENTTGTMEIKVGMHRSAANIDANRMGGLTQTTLATTTEMSTDESSYGLKDSKDKNTTVIIHGGYQESKALRTEEVDTESETDSSTETSGTELDVNTVNSMSSRPGGRGRGGDGGFVLLR